MTGLLLSNCLFFAEQPASSIVDLHPRWKQMADALSHRLRRVHLWMQSYGAGSPKPSLIFSNCNNLESLVEPFDNSKEKTVRTVNTYIDAQGNKRVTGTKDLKGTLYTNTNSNTNTKTKTKTNTNTDANANTKTRLQYEY